MSAALHVDVPVVHLIAHRGTVGAGPELHVIVCTCGNQALSFTNAGRMHDLHIRATIEANQ